ncbi:competence protein CoiA family protein [Citrifermentans bremense]|uniref:hypothetical protein n=1 Tax=Citrifermentans bremense TaxID=60035 RepID=UPI0012EBB7D5|nr:hypothetical protein [Citrifermentans bremense]
MDIKLPIALNTIDERLLYVADRLPAGAVLVCPFCRYPVKKNAGNIRRHHFVHMPGATCSVSYETLLHEGAKVYLHRCLERGEPVDIFIDTITLRPSKTRRLLESLGVRRFSTSSKSVFKNDGATHLLERVIAGKVKPDVVSYGEYVAGGERDIFAWEIFVTHEVEEEKAELLRINRVPYIELSPIEEGPNSYIYTMKSHDGISFIDDDAIFDETVYRDNKADLLATFEKEMTQEVLKPKLEDARKSWEAAADKSTEQELERRIVLKVGEITIKDAMAMAQAVSASPVVIFPVTNIPTGSGLIDDRWVKVETVGCEKYNGKYLVKLNERLYFSSGLGMLRGIYDELAKMGVLKGVTAKEEGRDKIIFVGVKLALPLVERRGIVECSSILYKYTDHPTEEVIMWETRNKKSKTSGKYYMLVNDDIFVDSYEWQLKNILYNLLRFTTIEAHLGLNADKKYRVDALKISGLVQVEKVKDTLLAAMTRPSVVP